MRSDAGLTIVELLVSLVILAMISLMIVAGVSTGRRVWERLDERAVAVESVEGAQTMLRARIERAYGATRFDQAQPYADFSGQTTRLDFLAEPTELERPQALRRYDLALGVNGDLLLSSWSDVAADPDHPAITTQLVLKGVQGLELAYFGAAPPDLTPRWRPQWDHQPALPRLIRVRVAFPRGDRRVWPDLIVKPAADVDVRCILDVATGHCLGRR